MFGLFKKLKSIWHKDKGHYSLSSDPSVKLKEIPKAIPEQHSYWVVDSNKVRFEVVKIFDYGRGKVNVCIANVNTGKEYVFPLEVFMDFFYEVHKPIYFQFNGKNKPDPVIKPPPGSV